MISKANFDYDNYDIVNMTPAQTRWWRTQVTCTVVYLTSVSHIYLWGHW